MICLIDNSCQLRNFSYFRSFNDSGLWIASSFLLAMTRSAYEREILNLEILESLNYKF